MYIHRQIQDKRLFWNILYYTFNFIMQSLKSSQTIPPLMPCMNLDNSNIDYISSCFSGLSLITGLESFIPRICSRNSFASFIFSASILILVIHRSRSDLFSFSSSFALSSRTVNDIPVVRSSSCRIYVSNRGLLRRTCTCLFFSRSVSSCKAVLSSRSFRRARKFVSLQSLHFTGKDVLLL